MDFEKHILAAQGYSELGMPGEALAELDAAESADSGGIHPELLQTRLQVLMRIRDWENAIPVGKRLCSFVPECAVGFLHTAFCQHELGRTSDAKETLLAGPSQMAEDATFHYNLACYDAVLGNTDEACTHLQRSFALDSDFRKLASIDPDLASIRDRIS